MKKRIISAVLLTIFLILLISFQPGFVGGLQSIFTGLASNQNMDVSIFIDGPPALLLIEPLNTTYNSSLIPLKFIQNGADNLWFNLDNGANITVTGNTTFSVGVGSHSLNLFANNSYGISVDNVFFSAFFAQPVNWPDGVYEPNATGLPGTHRFTFSIFFNDVIAENQSVARCDIKTSNGAIINVNRTLNANVSGTVQLDYTLKSTDSINKTAPWKIIKCNITKNGALVFEPLNYGISNGTIYVHENNWTRFSSVGDDAYRAGDCFLGIPKRYFNNSYYCDYAGDVAFAVTMSRGMNLEGDCHDTIDNDGNGNIDCSDIYCQGIIYSCKNHTWAGDPFGGSCSNGICTETKSVGGKSFTYSYTKYVQQSGTLKIRIQGDGYSTAAPVSFAISDLKGFTGYGKYNRTGYLALQNQEISLTAYKTESPGGVTGNIDMVMYVNLNATNYSVGTHDVSLYVRQYGEDLLIAGIPISVMNDAPSNWNESESLSGFVDRPCADSVDNDMNFVQNCLDINCTGQIGGTDCTGGNAYCQTSETTCYDCFDNDADSLTDCGEPGCDLLPGNYQNLSILCEYNGEGYGSINVPHNAVYPWTTACADSFNNDAEDGTDCNDATNCKGKGGTSTTLPCPAYENNSASWCFDSLDNDYNGQIDCSDSNCKGVSYGSSQCPINETLNQQGIFTNGQCFDSLDNDLNTFTDCADGNCWGMNNSANSTQLCQPLEFNATIPYQLCNDNFDNNNNALLDCNDLSCKGKFDVCSPCPAMENYTWRSCADSIDNDYNGQTDCNDARCAGEIGSTLSGQRCGTEICNDKFDNDADGSIDCADSGCNGQLGPSGETCQLTESSCSDNFDNDGDGLIDCIDSNCFGGGCSDSWTTSSCVEVPYTASLAQIASTTVSESHISRHYINTNYTIELKGIGSYSVVTITLGDATDSSKYFPYNATSCTLSGNSKLKWVASQLQVGQIQHDPVQVSGTNPLSGFDVFLTCSPLGSSQTKSYPITIANLNNGYSETGETSVTSTVYENTAPTVSTIETEPTDGNLTYGGNLKIRVVPNSDSSGICKLYLNVSGTIYESSDGNGIITLSNLRNDAVYTLSARAKDGVSNAGAWTSPQSFTLNINPKSSTTTLNRNEPFYKSTNIDIIATISATFTAADNDAFNSNCYYTLRNSTTLISSGSVSNFGSGSYAICNESIAVPAADNLYYLEMNITDGDGVTVKSDSKVLYVCNNLSGKGSGWDCGKADFDQDGYTEGLYTNLFGTNQTCDQMQSLLMPPKISAPVTPPGPSNPPGQIKVPPGQMKGAKTLRVNPSELKMQVMPGDVKERTLSIKNIGNLSIIVTVISNIDFFSIEGNNFFLAVNEERPIKIKFTIPDNLESGLYFGYIIVSAAGDEVVVPVSLEVGGKKAGFSVNVMIPNEFKTLKPKDELKTQITLFDINSSILGNSATITYIIKNSNNGIILQGSELIILTEQVFFKTFVLPSLPNGIYSVYISVKYEDMVASDSEIFTVSLAKPAPGIPIFGIQITASMLIIAGIIVASAIIIALLTKWIIGFYHSLGPGMSSVWAIKR